jgi:hypothetical protein
MPSITFNLYDSFRKGRFNSNTEDLTAATIKCALVTNSYVPNQNTDDFWNDVSANEVSGTNYSAGGNTLATPTVTLSGAGLVTVDASDPAAWSQSGTGFSNARYAVIYVSTGVSSTSDLIGYASFGSDVGNVSGDLTVTVNASGLFTSART